MRRAMIILAAIAGLAGGGAAGRSPDENIAARFTATDRAAIESLEADWTRAFLAKDYDRIEQIVAPEFKLVGWGEGTLRTTLRPAWMANARMFEFKVYETKVLDVVVIDDTAVASVSGN